MHVLKSFLKIVVLCSTFGHAAGRCIITPDTNGHVNIADGVTTIEDVWPNPTLGRASSDAPPPPPSHADRRAACSQYVFYGCTSLKSVTIPDSVTSIGDVRRHPAPRSPDALMRLV